MLLKQLRSRMSCPLLEHEFWTQEMVKSAMSVFFGHIRFNHPYLSEKLVLEPQRTGSTQRGDLFQCFPRSTTVLFAYQAVTLISAQTPWVHHQSDIIDVAWSLFPTMYPGVNHIIITGPWSVPRPWAVFSSVIPGGIPWRVISGVVPTVILEGFPVIVPVPSVPVVVSSFISFVNGVSSSVVPWLLPSVVGAVVVQFLGVVVCFSVLFWFSSFDVFVKTVTKML